MFDIGSYVACIAEGSAETAIIDILLDNHMLIFEREKLLDEKVIRSRSASVFESKYLRKGFEGKITVFRILDSRREQFNLSKAYQDKVDVINVITAPEIEMLIIFSENKYEEYKKSGEKPSVFCKSVLKYSKVKNEEFVSSYFDNADKLVEAIKLYASKSNIPKGESSLKDLLRTDLL